MRICMVGHDAGRYPGPERLLSAQFRRDGHHAFRTSRRRTRVAKLADMGLTLASRRYDVAIVSTYSTAALWYARLSTWIARRRGRRSVVFLHGGRLGERARRDPRSLRGLLRRADRIVAPSRFLAREVGEAMGVPIEVIPNPVETELYPKRVRRELRPRLFWLRSFRDFYRPETAIQVVARLRRRFPDARLVMAGPDHGALEGCRRLARRLGVESCVRFPGIVDKETLRRLGDGADLFLNTTSIDNTPVSVIEAMAMGLCVVSTDAGGLPDLLTHDENALLVPPDDPGAMTAAVLRLIHDPALAERLSRSAVRESARYDLRAVATRWYDLFHAL